MIWPPQQGRYREMAVVLDAHLPAQCKGIRFDHLAAILEAADKAGLLGSSLPAFQGSCFCGSRVTIYGPRDEAAQRVIAQFVDQHGTCKAGAR